MKHESKYPAFVLVVVLLLFFSPASAANIDPQAEGRKYSFAENCGWLNFLPDSGPGVTVFKDRLEGYVWAENIGWIRLDPQYGGVTHDGNGNLGGYGWSENAGWINFSCENDNSCGSVDFGVIIDGSTGVFSGYAWGENVGWISFDYSGFASAADYYVTTSGRFYAISLTNAGAGTGTVTSAPIGINCGADCNETYTEDTSVTLTAVADNDSQFSGWSGGGCYGTDTCQVTMDQALYITASFNLTSSPAHQLVIHKAGTGAGLVTSTPAGITCGEYCTEIYDENSVVTLSAVADLFTDGGSQFTGWSGGGCYGTGTCQVTMAQAREVTANFSLTSSPAYQLVVEKSGSGTGTITSTPPGISCGSDCTEIYDENDLVTLTAVADPGSEFRWWGGEGCSGTGAYELAMVDAYTVIATFGPKTYTITTSVSGGGTIEPSGPVSVEQGDNQTFIIMPDKRYEVGDVLVNGSSIGVTDSYTFTNVSGNRSLEARFEKKPAILMLIQGALGKVGEDNTR